jgi:hypothetical protein
LKHTTKHGTSLRVSVSRGRSAHVKPSDFVVVLVVADEPNHVVFRAWLRVGPRECMARLVNVLHKVRVQHAVHRVVLKVAHRAARSVHKLRKDLRGFVERRHSRRVWCCRCRCCITSVVEASRGKVNLYLGLTRPQCLRRINLLALRVCRLQLADALPTDTVPARARTVAGRRKQRVSEKKQQAACESLGTGKQTSRQTRKVLRESIVPS